MEKHAGWYLPCGMCCRMLITQDNPGMDFKRLKRELERGSYKVYQYHINYYEQ